MAVNAVPFQDVGELGRFLAHKRQTIERALEQDVSLASGSGQTPLAQAVRYALFPGGKRLRPALVLLGSELIGGNASDVYRMAAVAEYIHISSLILDDLPCMDNATTRRGRPCVHEVYGVGLSLLASISLLNAAFELTLKSFSREARLGVHALGEVVDCVGARGMVAGQAEDLTSRRKPENVRAGSIYRLKTSSLIRLSLRLGALAAGGSDRQLDVLSSYSALLGEVYQLNDDLDDLIEDDTAPRARAEIANARARAASLVVEAQQLISAEFGSPPAARILCELAQGLGDRIERSDCGPAVTSYSASR